MRCLPLWEGGGYNERGKDGDGVINENIRNARREKGVSQEELAVRLNVVRQTVSKWERGLSVPDADVLIQIAELLDVPVERLLGSGDGEGAGRDLSESLAEANERLAVMVKRERINRQANKKRGMILFLAFTSLMLSLAVKNEVVSIVLVAGCTLASLIILYRNLALLTVVTADDLKIRTLRTATIFDIVIAVISAAVVVLDSGGTIAISQESEKLMAMAITIAVMVFGGFISPRLPFNRHTGLRLPWTVQDEDTWNVAHRVLGYISLPMALMYLAAALTIDNFKTVSIAAVLLWVGVPAILSLIFFCKNTHHKL